MKKYLFTLFIFCSLFLKGQNPLVKMWDKRFGGTDDDILYTMQETADGGFILGGRTISNIGGDKTQPLRGGQDYWIVKVDSNGNKEWDRDFGGDLNDQLFSLQQTTDGGYILGGQSYSDSSGDKTERLWGGADFWIIKIDSSGNKQWDRDYGGTGSEGLISLHQTNDRGYILGGSSDSDSSGDKTQDNKGINDYWIIKIDSLGNKQWDKSFGGTESDGISFVSQTNDEGYILGGASSSGVSGDKTEPIYGVWPDYDYWIIKTDSLGNKEWDKDFGGNDGDLPWMVKQLNEHGYVISGSSASGISGNKSQPVWGADDYWIVKIDSLGNKQWDKDYGGSNWDAGLVKLDQTIDLGFLISGLSYSGISGNKTENNLGPGQTWFLKIDSAGNILWDKTVQTATPFADVGAFGIQVNEGCYVIANCTESGIGGEKTQYNQDPTDSTHDFWIVKFCDSTFLPPTATVFTDSLLCPGTCTNFTNLSFNGASYQWSFPGATPPTSTDVNPTNICYPTPGSYDVQLIASNTNGSDTLLLTNYITVNPSPPPQSITQSGDTLFAASGSASYQWYFNTNLISGATDYFYVALSTGDYNVVATDANGCEVEAAIFNVIAATTEIGSLDLFIFPNPVVEKFTMHNSKFKITTAKKISIYNVFGENVLAIFPSVPTCQASIGSQTSNFTHETIIDVSDLTSGLYFLELATSERTYRCAFVKSHIR